MSELPTHFHISHHAAKNPDKVALIMNESGRRVTFGELNNRSCQVAHLLRGLGLKRGDHIALMVENSPEFFEICQAAQRSGLYYTAISTRLTEDETRYVIENSGAKVFFISASLSETGMALERTLSSAVVRYAVGGALGDYASYEEARDAQPETPIADESTGADMLYSSGTTGRPKGIRRPLPEEPLGAEALPFIMLVTQLYQFGEDMVYLSPAPLYHSAPGRFTAVVLRMGGTVVVMEKFDPEGGLAAMEKHNTTHGQWVPTMFVRMLKLPEEVRSKYDVSSLKCAIHAAAPCPVEIKRQMIDWWGKVIYEYYGGTEGNGLCGLNSEEWLAHPGSVGKPMTGILHICGEDGKEVPVGEEGAIFFESETMFEYHGDPEKTRDSRHAAHEDWSTIGDIGRVDEDGFLYLTDRKAHMIISGGVNIYPQETEDRLILHERVADAAVIGVPNEEFGEEVKAVIQPANWADAGEAFAEELMAFCRTHLSPIKCPRSIDFERELPRHPTGKLYKRLLRDRYWEGHKSKII